MESSPSRNPLLSREEISTDEEDDESQENMQATIVERNNYIATSQSSSSHKEDKRRNLAAPVDRYNFAYIVFYILGMYETTLNLQSCN